MSTTTSVNNGRYSGDDEIKVTSLGARTTVGNTSSIRNNALRATLQVQVETVGTDVQVALVGSLDGTNFFNVGSTTTITANGYTAYTYTDLCLPFIAARLVAVNTGTPTVTFTLAYS